MKIIAQNRKAYHDYFVEEKYEAGISLAGTEVKSLRLGQVNLKDAYCRTDGHEIFVIGMHISPYEKSNSFLIKNRWTPEQLRVASFYQSSVHWQSLSVNSCFSVSVKGLQLRKV